MKKIFALLLIFVSAFAFAKPNPKAQGYKTHETKDKSVPVVYLIRDISPEALVKVYQATGYKTSGKVGVKVSTGESENSNYLRPALIKNLVKDELNATIVECNTAYGGGRSNNIDHIKIARNHGFLDVANGFDLQDAEGYMTLPVKGGERLTENYVGSHFADYDTYLILSHFKGHAMAEAAKSVCDYMQGGRGIVCVNVMNRISVDCDCDANPAEPDMHDIGILASLDPVALDQACVDLIYTASDGGSVVERIESRNGNHTLEHAEKIGFGSRKYRLMEIK